MKTYNSLGKGIPKEKKRNQPLLYQEGGGFTLNEIHSSGYWVLGCRAVVCKLIDNCVVCRRTRATMQDQKMNDLPKDTSEPIPPFTFWGVDYFVPWYVKEGRKEPNDWFQEPYTWKLRIV